MSEKCKNNQSSLNFDDSLAKDYDSWFSKHNAIFQSEIKLIETMGISSLVLDVGVGSGIFASNIVNDKVVVVGIDPSLEMLILAKSRGIDVVQAISEILPFTNEQFDCVMMINTLCFLVDPEAVMAECIRVLRTDGFIFVCEVPKDSLWGRSYQEKGRRGHRFYRYARFYTVSEISKMVESLGMKIITTRGTLSYGPDEPEVVEEPQEDRESLGFVCIKARKVCG